jgi:hypothetical protein
VNTVFTGQSPDWRASASCHHTMTDSIVCLCHSRMRKFVDVVFHAYIAKSTDITQIALLEWSAAVHDLITVSIHTYERAPQLVSLLLIGTLAGISPSFPSSSSLSTRHYSDPNSGPTPHPGAPRYPSQKMLSPFCPSTNPKRISTSWNKISGQGVFDAL